MQDIAENEMQNWPWIVANTVPGTTVIISSQQPDTAPAAPTCLAAWSLLGARHSKI